MFLFCRFSPPANNQQKNKIKSKLGLREGEELGMILKSEISLTTFS